MIGIWRVHVIVDRWLLRLSWLRVLTEWHTCGILRLLCRMSLSGSCLGCDCGSLFAQSLSLLLLLSTRSW